MTTSARERPIRRPSSWMAIALLLAALAMVVFSLISVTSPGTAELPNRPDLGAFLAATFAFVTLPTVGALLAILRPANPIGWLFLVSGFGFIAGIFSTEYVGQVVILDADLPGAQLVDWLGTWAGGIAIGLAVVWIPLLFPDGRLPGPRWRPVAWTAAVLMAASTLASMVQPVGPIGTDGPTGYLGLLPNPLAMDGTLGDAAIAVAALPWIAIFGPLALASLVLRFRRSSGIERQQLKWFLFAAAFLLIALLTALALQQAWGWYLTMLGFALLPVAAAVAVLRYRLYEIDRIISRTVAYAIVTGTLAVVFVGIVLALTAVPAFLSGGNTVAVAASTLVVAALFQPLRRRVQRTVDRRFDRARYDGERLIDGFNRQLRDEVDIERLRANLLNTTDEAVRPTSSAVWLRGGSEGAR